MRSRILLCFLFVAASSLASTRPPAVAGAFYTDDPKVLRSQIESMLEAAPKAAVSRALVVPHAGYTFSGAVAAKAFATLEGDGLERVILIGPSHHRAYEGGALPARGVDAFSTPLGEVLIDRDALVSLRSKTEFGGPAEAHGPEHSLEVELPFLQVIAPKAKIVPILVGGETGAAAARRMAQALLPLINDKTAVIVSSDFTHHGERYRWAPFSEPELGEQLVHLGRVTAGRLAAMDAKGFSRQVDVSGDTICGARPAIVLAELLAHAFNGTGEVLEVTTSGHLTGSWELSVTYVSIAFRGSWSDWRDPPPAPALGEMTEAQGAEMVALARASLESFLRHDGSLAEWYAAHGDTTLRRAPAGAFVTLNRKGKRAGDPGRLRACMGVIEAAQPLADAVLQASVWASQDPRFPRLAAEELDGLEVEVSALSPARRVAGPSAIVVGKHGVILEKDGHRALFLPQVATEQGWDRRTMLGHLARKAGLPDDGWREGAVFEVFTAQVFGEGH